MTQIEATERPSLSLDRRGVQDDMSSFMAEYRPRILGAIRTVLGRCPEEEDIAQEVFLRLVVRLRQPGELCIGAWTWTVARNLAIDYGRSRRRLSGNPLPPSVAAPDDPERAALGTELGEELTAAVARLPVRQRQAISASLACRTDRDSRHARVAAALCISDKAAESLLGRARANLRMELNRRGTQIQSAFGALIAVIRLPRVWSLSRSGFRHSAVVGLSAATVAVVSTGAMMISPLRTNPPRPTRPAPMSVPRVGHPASPASRVAPAIAPPVASSQGSSLPESPAANVGGSNGATGRPASPPASVITNYDQARVQADGDPLAVHTAGVVIGVNPAAASVALRKTESLLTQVLVSLP